MAKELGEAVVEITREHGFPQEHATSAFVDGWAAVGGGRLEEAIASIREGLAAWRAVGRAYENPMHWAITSICSHRPVRPMRA